MLQLSLGMLKIDATSQGLYPPFFHPSDHTFTQLPPANNPKPMAITPGASSGAGPPWAANSAPREEVTTMPARPAGGQERQPGR